jgi:asparagine synthase (glutamine-hydrolysing)
MCGIAGGVALTPEARPDPARVAAMSCLVAHRGPDGEGVWQSASGRACLAHRRLSVIDLATGQQPMVSEDNEVGLVFNGEIYNYRELRNELAAAGATFRTESDTEVLLRLVQRRGPECVGPLRGMFAFAAWNERLGRLIVARDRVGKKPLYYTIDGGCLYFASSLKALEGSAPVKREVSAGAVDAFLTLGYVPAPGTIFQGVSKLDAATILEVDAGGVRERRFWDLAANPEPFTGTYEEAVDRVDELLNTAVSLRLRSDVPLGVFLSGGIDSSLVAAVAQRQSPVAVSTFSIGFDTNGFDESAYAAEVAERLGTKHRLFRAQPDLLATLPQLVWHYGEPFADSSALPQWLLAEHTRQHVTVALGGDGGDEGFAGYDWYATAARLSRVARAVPERAVAAASSVLGSRFAGSRRAGQARRGVAMLSARDDAQRFASLRSFVGPADARALYAGELAAVRAGRDAGFHSPAADAIAALYRRGEGSALRRMRYADIRSYLADCLMPKVDVATMAHGLEARAPLLDQEVLAFALSLPDDYVRGPDGGKRVLRSVLSRYLPAALFDRPKQGFSVPLRSWFLQEARSTVAALPTSERLLETGWFNAAGLRGLVDEHAAGLRDNSDRLYALLVLDEWLKRR